MYDLTNIIDVEQASSIRPGSSLLVTGSMMGATDDLLQTTLATGARAGDGAVAVTTGGRAEDLVADLRDRENDIDPTLLCAIDCRAESSRESTELDSGAYVHRVASPSDMTGIGIGITECFDRLRDAGVDRGRLALTNLSTMVTYTDKQTVFKMCHVLSSRLDSAEFLGVFAIDAAAHDDRTLQVIKQAFDGLIELREGETGREARLSGVEPDPSEWVAI